MSMNDPLLPVLPPEAPDFRPVRGLAIAASVLVAVVCVLNVAATWLGWTTYQLILCVAGVFVVLTIRQITAWQETPRPA
ncbi:hypothetical protein BLA60_28355 [Actinophytocola xinjiangensis]|uniref:Uncharacterized protein n=1 Tax=Actinophytocola xinjiangensis TaxID=485602 RepID=A0A7Z1AW17_9PSEU|nr:hypothetical protein [Actinophytocola xinjiangensis]OLF07127.1 hypothetical protein BLA60_28355 [Actinophytocola xinjiangensis]